MNIPVKEVFNDISIYDVLCSEVCLRKFIIDVREKLARGIWKSQGL